MSYQAVDAVLRHSQSKNAARLVLIAIASHAGPDGNGSFPGESTICTEANLSARAVKYAIAELEEGREITIQRNTRGYILSYTINLPIKQKTDKAKAQDTPSKGAGFAPLTVQDLHPKKPAPNNRGCKIRKSRVQNSSIKGANFASPPAPPIRNNRIEPLEETVGKENILPTPAVGQKKNTKQKQQTNPPKSPHHSHAGVAAYRDTLGYAQIATAQADLIANTLSTPNEAPAPQDWQDLLQHLAEIGISWKQNVRRVTEIFQIARQGHAPKEACAIFWEREKGHQNGHVARGQPIAQDLPLRTRQNRAAVEQAIATFGGKPDEPHE